MCSHDYIPHCHKKKKTNLSTCESYMSRNHMRDANLAKAHTAIYSPIPHVDTLVFHNNVLYNHEEHRKRRERNKLCYKQK